MKINFLIYYIYMSDLTLTKFTGNSSALINGVS